MKVVVNCCYGGFGLSDDALGWLREREWKHCDRPESAPRHDPLLVKCVETLGSMASGQYANLVIEDTGHAYKIIAHDGFESVESAGWDAITITDEEVNERVAQAIAAERERAAAELAAMRARTIEECTRAVDSCRDRGGVGTVAGADSCIREYALDDAWRAIIALATPTPTTEPAHVDPAAGALR